MEDRMRMSKVYSLAISGILLLAFLIGSVYVPMGAFEPAEFLAVLETNAFITGLIFYITILAAVTLGLASMIYEFELTQDRIIDAQHRILSKLDEIVEKTTPPAKPVKKKDKK